ncbi:MAG: hypothetical protein J3Q66DRAFT_438558 [Benniella sp.]|nr:MAG: hypothetical protein J3Q66DRAFT_438558 [Benniella sp.]
MMFQGANKWLERSPPPEDDLDAMIKFCNSKVVHIKMGAITVREALNAVLAVMDDPIQDLFIHIKTAVEAGLARGAVQICDSNLKSTPPLMVLDTVANSTCRQRIFLQAPLGMNTFETPSHKHGVVLQRTTIFAYQALSLFEDCNHPSRLAWLDPSAKDAHMDTTVIQDYEPPAILAPPALPATTRTGKASTPPSPSSKQN